MMIFGMSKLSFDDISHIPWHSDGKGTYDYGERPCYWLFFMEMPRRERVSDRQGPDLPSPQSFLFIKRFIYNNNTYSNIQQHGHIISWFRVSYR